MASVAANVLVLLSDEHQRRALGCAGHPVVQTPNLDALAARGTRFTDGWSPSPICVPARGSLATGRWVHDVGTWDSAQAYRGEPQGWAHLARAAGLHVVAIGKLHHRSGADDQGFTEIHLPMYIVDGVGWVQGLARRDPLPYPEAAELAAQVGTGETSYTRYDRRITDRACRWLDEHGAGERPWVLFVSLVAPHYPYSAPEEFMNLYRRDLPPPEIGPMPRPHPTVAALADYFAYHRYFDEETAGIARRAYFGLCSYMDHNVGLVLEALERCGASDRTRVIYTSDHGEMLGNRGLWAKSYMYEDSVGVPLIAAGPGIGMGQVVDTPTNLVDVHATVLDVLGVADDAPGESLRTLARGDSPDRVGFSEYHDGGSPTASYALRFDRWKYICHYGERPELYDMVDDPDELADLGEDPAFGRVRSEGEERLRELVDPGAANQAAFESQRALIEELGGREALSTYLAFNTTPAPS